MDPDPEGGQLFTDPEPDILKTIEFFLSNRFSKSLEFIKFNEHFFPILFLNL
jgi:hypothetical protein